MKTSNRLQLPSPLAFVFVVLSALAISSTAVAQTKYWVFFKDKPVQRFDPYAYFDKLAIERRQHAGLPLYDESDLAVNEDYVKQVVTLSDSAGNTSRWFNAVAVWAQPGQLNAIRALPGVKNVEQMTYGAVAASLKGQDDKNADEISEEEKELLEKQTGTLQASVFTRHNITGKGVRIAVFDVGFKHADEHEAFKQIFANKQIYMTHDFIKNKDDVYRMGFHGTMVLSCITGMYKGQQMGLAPDAEFLLARTERTVTEVQEEEDNWIAAAEWADKNGARIISSSLGYTDKRYFRRDMDGKTSIVARGAKMAAAKGILVVNAAGNEATNSWKYLSTPADADSVLTIGGIDPENGYHINFSSLGPTADRRLKPNVVASGHTLVARPNGSYSTSYGTSFATPLISGFAACVMQLHPEYTNMQVFHELEKAGHLYPYYDYAHGYGIPQASYFFDGKRVTDETLKLRNEGDDQLIELLPEAFDSAMSDTSRFFYYHLEDEDGYLLKYALIGAKEALTYHVNTEEFPQAVILAAYFRGYTTKIKLKK